MSDIRNYLIALQEGLEKKLGILETISQINELQRKSLEADQAGLEAFEATLDEKERYVEELVALDNGFEAVYERIKENLSENKSQYAVQIQNMQQYIRRVTELSVQIQREEQRNKELVEKRFAKLHQSVNETRKNSRAVSNYYKSMSKLDTSPQFMDSKK